MNTYWLPNAGTAEHFWEHEWSKHGTCINTLAPSCYGDGYEPGAEVVDFFNRAVEVFKVGFHSRSSGIYHDVLITFPFAFRDWIPTKHSKLRASRPRRARLTLLTPSKQH